MKSWIFIILLLGILTGGVGYYYNTTQTYITELTEANSTLVSNNEQLMNANRENLETINELTETFEETREKFNRVQTEFQEVRSQNRKLKERLGKHELGALAAERPELVGRIINNASDEALRCFELLSGSPLNESERNAQNARQFNSECLWLWEKFN